MPRTARTLAAGSCIAALLLLLAACTRTTPRTPSIASSAVSSGASGGSSAAPSLRVAVVARGLDHPWDVAQVPDGTLLLDERAGGFRVVLRNGRMQEVSADFADLFALGETGLMGLVLDPGFTGNRRFYTCQGRRTGGPSGAPSISVVAWVVDPAWHAARRVADPLLGGIPANGRIGRHGGCRLRFDPAGALLVSTGDNAVGSNAQDPRTLAGKVLRIDAATGRPWPGNPFAGRPDAGSPYVFTYGHRNVQGLAVRPGTGQVFSVEQGTFRDDEVNLLRAGANYGYDPDGAGSTYDESVPMTDPAIPGAVAAVWSSGRSTIATCGGTFLSGPQWGSYDGLLLLGALKGTGVVALRLGPDGTLQRQFRLPELENRHGRIRTVQQGVDGALYVTTDNGDHTDELLRVTPR